MPELTVILSTHNGENVIRETLEGYCLLNERGVDWNIIIVNNGSNDRTADIVHKFLDRLPLKILPHHTLGKNRALNAALGLIDSEFVIITDDDAVPQHGFLKEWLDISHQYPDFAIFGGTIIPSFTVPPPEWMLESQFHFAELYAARNLANGPIKATEIFGPNMAVRKRVFDSGIKFNEDIGPNGHQQYYPMGSETEFCHRVELDGYRAYFASGPTVKHIIRPHQTSEDFWINRAYKHGLGFGLQNSSQYSTRSLLKRILSNFKFYAYHCIGRLQILFIKDRLTHNQKIWELNWNRGFLIGRSSNNN